MQADPATFKLEMRDFWNALPFNLRGSSPAQQAKSIKRTDRAKLYPPFLPLLSKGTRALEVGCGIGWMANSIAWHQKCDVTAIDFTPSAIARARDISKALKTNIVFHESDLFEFEPESRFDVVYSLGVLHHTSDCIGALKLVLNKFVKPGGHAFIGLYHTYGRRPFLKHFSDLRASGVDEEGAYREFCKLHNEMKDETQLRSWFRDQVLVPHETQHTIDELLPVFKELDATLLSTSINHFAPNPVASEIVEREKAIEDYANEKLAASEYFPGYFVFLLKARG